VTMVGPRMMYALAKGGHLPKALGEIHRRFQTPFISIVLFALAAWILSLFNDFAGLAALSSIARLLYYIASCLAVPILSPKMRKSGESGHPSTLGTRVVPLLATAICVWLLTSITRHEAIVGVSALLLGALVNFGYRAHRRMPKPDDPL